MEETQIKNTGKTCSRYAWKSGCWAIHEVRIRNELGLCRGVAAVSCTHSFLHNLGKFLRRWRAVLFKLGHCRSVAAVCCTHSFLYYFGKFLRRWRAVLCELDPH